MDVFGGSKNKPNQSQFLASHNPDGVIVLKPVGRFGNVAFYG